MHSSLKSHPRLEVFILEAMTSALQIALAEAKAEQQKTALARSMAQARQSLPWFKFPILKRSKN